ncbi:hypothetical protein BLA15816_07975 [Burkholderia lata]|nr:hypothetical protein BLA15816_07975 [Burkholderia lata]
MFQGYYERYGVSLGDRLPALIPQVYLHYDPYTRRQRGDEQFLVRQRMDFLLMLEQGVRIVIEIDGRHHYAVQDALAPDRFIANAPRYAEMVAEDRRLRLMGYEVYRFGGYEFMDVDLRQRKVGPHAQQCVAEFFDRLLARHGVRCLARSTRPESHKAPSTQPHASASMRRSQDRIPIGVSFAAPARASPDQKRLRVSS